MSDNRTLIEQIIRRVDLRALAEEAGARFSASGSSRCPLHGGDNPTAFHLYQGRDGRMKWHCFTNCPENANDGDVINFYMRWRGVDFRTAVEELARRAGVQVGETPPRKPSRHRRESPAGKIPLDVPPLAEAGGSPSSTWSERAEQFITYAQEQLWAADGEAVREYLHEQRGLSDETIRAWRLGYNPRPVWDKAATWGLDGKAVWLPRGVVIPGIRDGQAWYVKVRRPLPDDSLAEAIGPVERLVEMKFVSVRGSRLTLWGADGVRGLPVLVLVEGEWDGLLTWQEANDFCDVVAQGGASRRLRLDDALLLLGAAVVLVVYDADVAGERGARRLSKFDRVRIVHPPAHDLVDYYLAGGDLRRWLASLVSPEMEDWLNGLDMQRQGEAFVRGLHVHDVAEEVIRNG